MNIKYPVISAGRRKEKSNMETLERIYCADCGNIIEEGEEYYNTNNEPICEACSEDYLNCERCGAIIYHDDAIMIDDGRLMVCEDCANRHYWQCDHCHEYVSRRRLWYTGNITLCEWCSDDYFICYRCGDAVSYENAYYIDGEAYCEECATNERTYIHDYGYKPDPRFFGGDAGFGVELEIDDGCYKEEAAEAIQNIGGEHIYLKEDGSLSPDGFEIVTHPATLQYHMEEFPWNKILNTALEYEYKSHDTNTCGLHIHASRELFGHDRTLQDLNIAKCMLLIDAYWHQYIVPFSRRDYDRLERWANKPDAGITTNDDEYIAIDKAKKAACKGRYQAVNLQNYNTVEFRFFRGTLRLNTILASIQFVHVLIEYVKNTQLKDIFNHSFLEIFANTEYIELTEYLKKRNIIKEAK